MAAASAAAVTSASTSSPPAPDPCLLLASCRPADGRWRPRDGADPDPQARPGRLQHAAAAEVQRHMVDGSTEADEISWPRLGQRRHRGAETGLLPAGARDVDPAGCPSDLGEAGTVDSAPRGASPKVRHPDEGRRGPQRNVCTAAAGPCYPSRGRRTLACTPSAGGAAPAPRARSPRSPRGSCDTCVAAGACDRVRSVWLIDPTRTRPHLCTGLVEPRRGGRQRRQSRRIGAGGPKAHDVATNIDRR